MSLVAIAVGLVMGLTQPLRRAVTAAAAAWLLTTVYLALIAGPETGQDSSNHAVTTEFWVFQAAFLLAALAVAWAASRFRAHRAG
jgi:hypothetical protein